MPPAVSSVTQSQILQDVEGILLQNDIQILENIRMATYQVLALGHEECFLDYSLDPSRTFFSSSKTQPNGREGEAKAHPAGLTP